MLFLDLSSMFSLSMELERLNSEPCACFSGFISPVPPFPQLLLEALEHSVCMCVLVPPPTLGDPGGLR